MDKSKSRALVVFNKKEEKEKQEEKTCAIDHNFVKKRIEHYLLMSPNKIQSILRSEQKKKSLTTLDVIIAKHIQKSIVQGDIKSTVFLINRMVGDRVLRSKWGEREKDMSGVKIEIMKHIHKNTTEQLTNKEKKERDKQIRELEERNANNFIEDDSEYD